MQVPSIFKPSLPATTSIHKWPRLLKRVILSLAALFCIGIYLLLAIGLISLLALMVDLIP